MFKILDCTLRDGGYYNNWDFDETVVYSYLQAMADSKIDYVELGLRNFSKPGFCGAFAYTTENFLNRLELPIGPTYGVMVDAKTILNSGMSIEDAVDKLFVDASDSKISLVRVAAHFHEVENSGEIIKALKAKGYIVGYNLMQAGGKSAEIIAEKARIATSWEVLDVLYFADSLGNMDTAEVLRIISAIQDEWNGELGIHTHNNMGKALDNTLIAKDNGVAWLDSTVTGMGRGAGNAQTESLLAVTSVDNNYYNPSYVYELAIRHFEPMQKSCGWGSNLLYFLGAQNNVHPTYIQNLLSDTHYGTDEIVGAIEYLNQLDDTYSYNDDIYKAALSFNSSDKPIAGTNCLANLAEEREILILANGPSLDKYSKDIASYIDINKPLVIAINAISSFADQIDFYCISHNSKFLAERDSYRSLKKPIIMPKHRFSSEELEELSENLIYDYGMEISDQTMKIHPTYCQVPYDVTTAYAISIAIAASAKSVSVVGFDGYDYGDKRQLEMVDISTYFNQLKISCELTALTPTSYPIKQGSIYAPIG
jgi:4-hydroxy 2-oxovalerate aldolase